MKVYSIGREIGCDITINDNSDVISRRHATLNVTSSGKMTIVDLSHNGTYVNGIRIAPNVPVPVTRKDNVSFAHVARLDWNLIPNTGATIIRWVVIGVVALLLILGSIWAFSAFAGKEPAGGGDQPAPVPVAVDSTDVNTQKQDSIDQHKRDSIAKHKEDSVNKAKQKNAVKPAPKKVEPKKAEPKKSEPKKNEPKKEEPTKTRVRG